MGDPPSTPWKEHESASDLFRPEVKGVSAARVWSGCSSSFMRWGTASSARVAYLLELLDAKPGLRGKGAQARSTPHHRFIDAEISANSRRVRMPRLRSACRSSPLRGMVARGGGQISNPLQLLGRGSDGRSARRRRSAT